MNAFENMKYVLFIFAISIAFMVYEFVNREPAPLTFYVLSSIIGFLLFFTV